MTNYRGRVLQVANVAGAGELLSAPGANYQYILVDLMASEDTTLKETDNSGAVIAHVADGNIALNAPIIVTANKAIYSTAGNVTATYVKIHNAVSE
jgi:hypothetical protein